MFEEAQLYSPVSHHEDGSVEVHRARPSRVPRSRLPGPPQRHRRSRRRLAAW